jgi:hypothetical protein
MPSTSRVTGTFPTLSCNALKRKVQTACGSWVRDVQVTSDGSQGQLVRVRVANAVQQQEIIGRLTTVYELSSPRVRVEVVIEDQK